MAVAPGRDAQIEQRLNEAKNSSVPVSTPAVQQQPSANSQPEQPSIPRSSHKSLLGVNLDKLNTLESIQFQSGLKLGGQMGGEMYNSIAYIRYWKKKSDAETTQSSEQVVENAESYTCLPSSLLWGPEALKLSLSTEFSPTSNIASFGENASFGQSFLPGLGLNPGSFDPNLSLTLTGTFANLNVPQTVPTTPGSSSSPAPAPGTSPSAVVPVSSLQPTDYAVNSNFFKSCPKLNGTVASANPNGGFNGFVRRFLGLQYQNQTSYKGILSNYESSGYGSNYDKVEYDVEGATGEKTDSLPGMGVWQFLFNPEEIDWEGGPEYGESETWGVMGEANAGRPLFWKYMKNQRLTFSKVLLNGYVFGKRVDSLEKGLKDLFMEDTGANPNGPPALEFVWGGRVFGPCLIKDVKIKEKNWDNGYLVNAEVSFTLEKIPEWVINDGEVDVARPSSQSIAPELFNPPPAPASTTEEAADDTPPASTGNTGGNAPTAAYIEGIKKCTLAARGKNCIPSLINALGRSKPPRVVFKQNLLRYAPRQYLSVQQFKDITKEAERVEQIISPYRAYTLGIALDDYNRFLNKFIRGSDFSVLKPFDASFLGSGDCSVRFFQERIKVLNKFYDQNLTGLNGASGQYYTILYYSKAKEYIEKVNRDYYGPILKCSKRMESFYISKYNGLNCSEIIKKALQDKRVEQKDLRDCNK